MRRSRVHLGEIIPYNETLVESRERMIRNGLFGDPIKHMQQFGRAMRADKTPGVDLTDHVHRGAIHVTGNPGDAPSKLY